MESSDIERTIKRGSKIVKGDCSGCPFLRLYSYPVCYCLHAVVDWSRLCPYDYDLKRARKTYDDNLETIKYWDEYSKREIWGALDVNVSQ